MSVTILDGSAGLPLLLKEWAYLTKLPNQNDVKVILTDAVQHVQLEPRQILYRQGEPNEYIYHLLKGSLFQERTVQEKGQRPQRVLYYTQKPGAVAGRYDMFYERAYATTARALGESCELLKIKRSAIDHLVYRMPPMRNELIPLKLVSRLRTMPFLADLELRLHLSCLADVAKQQTVDAGKPVYKAGDNGATVYLIDQGQVKLMGGSEGERWLGNGAVLGLQEESRGFKKVTPYDHDATAQVKTKLIAIPREDFIGITGWIPEPKEKEWRQKRAESLNRLLIFSKYTPEECKKLAGFVSHHLIPYHHIVMQQEQISDRMWVLMEDSRAVMHALDGGGNALQPKDVAGLVYFSEISLRLQYPLESTVDAQPNSHWLTLDRRDFNRFLAQGPDSKSLLDRMIMSRETNKLLGESKNERRFPWLQDGERLLRVGRRHWFALLMRMRWPAIILATALVVGIILHVGLTGVALWKTTWWILSLAAFLVVTIWQVVDYENDFMVVTNQRVARQEAIIFVNEWRQVAFVEQVQNIDITTDYFGRKFGFGTIKVSTAGSAGTIEFDMVANPDAIKSDILAQRDRRRQHAQGSSKMGIQQILETRLGLTLELPPRVRDDKDASLDKVEPPWWRKLLEPSLDRPMRYQNQSKVIWRKHWLVLAPQLLRPLLLFLICLFVVVATLYTSFSLASAVLVLPAVLGAMVAVAWTVWVYVDWSNDTYELDDNTVVDIEKQLKTKWPFITEAKRSAKLGQIENIDLEIPGPINYLFNFGNVKLQTAAVKGDFTFDWVPDPRGVAEEIRRRIDNTRRKEEADRAKAREKELSTWFEMYNRLDSHRLTNPTLDDYNGDNKVKEAG
ncbi:MAG: cyclic nucleotide-binding domain-containing protein [Caldilineaceae bacterium]